MGIESRALRERLGGRMFGKHWRPPLRKPTQGFVFMDLRIDPPTVTHHAKHLTPVGKKGGGWRMTLADDPALVAAREQYLLAIPERAYLIPLQPPIVLHVTFWWSRPGPNACHTVKPDASNAVKALEDILSLRGYWDDDAEISDQVIKKRFWNGPGYVIVQARTLAGPGDKGQRIEPADDEVPFVVHPVPWQADQDLAAVAAGQSFARAIEKLGNPGGERKPSNPKRIQPWQTLAKAPRRTPPAARPLPPDARRGPGTGVRRGERQKRSNRARRAKS